MLQGLSESERQIERLRERVIRIEAELMRITPRLAGMPGGADRDKIADGVAKIVDLEQEILNRMFRLENERLRIEDEIAQLPEQQKRVISARYVEGKSWKKVAKETHYNAKYVFMIHRAALSRLGNKDVTK